MSLIDLNTISTLDHQVLPLINRDHFSKEPENKVSSINLNATHENDREIMFSIDLNSMPEEALPEEETISIHNELPEVYQNQIDRMEFEHEPHAIVFTGKSTLPPLPQGRRRGQAPIPAFVKWKNRPEWLPQGWWIDYRVRPRSIANHILTYKNYVDPESGRKFRSKKEVERYLHPEIVLERENVLAANPNGPRLRRLIWGRTGKRSGLI